MVKKTKNNKSENVSKEVGEKKPSFFRKTRLLFQNETAHFVVGLIMVIFSVYLLLAFASFFVTGAADQSIIESATAQELAATNNQVKNYAGSQGARLSNYLINDCFGLASVFIPLFLAVLGLKLMRVRKANLWRWFICCSLMLVWFSIFLAYAFGNVAGNTFVRPGGMHGQNVSLWIESQIGIPGVWLLLLVTAICFLIYLSARTIIWLRKLFSLSFIKPLRKAEQEKGEVPEEFDDSWTAEGWAKSAGVPDADVPTDDNPDDIPQEPLNTENAVPDDVDVKVPEEDGVEIVIESSVEETTDDNGDREDAQPGQDKEEEEAPFVVTLTEDEEPMDADKPLEPYNPRLDLEFYKFPTLDLLKMYEDNTPAVDMDEQKANKDNIVRVLRTFNIEISSIRASVGPTITLYEITPAEGVRITRIRSLQDDIALGLKALGIRIIAPIPGRGTIGIEVPNANPRIVPMLSVLNSKKFQEAKMELPVAIGKTISNDVFMFDLAKAPHLLVAGATGQGKSVGLNAILTSLLFKKHPSELKFVIVDPKMVEFSIYAPIEKHFLAKLPENDKAIITDTDKVVQTLQSLCVEMDARYELLMQAACRNIIEYNGKFVSRKLNPEKGHHFMPYIVVIIDEYGDLIMTAGKEIETPICRIAQKARAVGIHMIIATQRPTANIITGTIKANFPARIAFKVADSLNSRTILDTTGADQLIGKGDMLYSIGNDPIRVQCAFVDTPEVEDIAEYIGHQQGYPTAYPLPEVPGEEGGGSNLADVDMGKLDPLFREAAELIVTHQSGSTSLIQRKFSLGYNRAGRLMDQLEKAGIVGPAQGSKPREVYPMDLTDLEMRLNNFFGTV